MTRPPVEIALEYAAHGWPVFPCAAATKAPLVARGLYAATTNESIIREWWSRNPDAMIGVPTGEMSGIWVLDIDKGHGVDGEAAIANLEAEHGALPETIVSNTPSGGRHLMFRMPEGVEIKNRGRFVPGADTRGNGGYIIAPGSVRDDGTYYEWGETTAGEPADAPQWLLDMVTRKEMPKKDTPASPYQSGSNDAYVDAAISSELSDLAAAPGGSRNNRLNLAAFALGQFVGSGAISEFDARIALEAIARQWPNFRKSQQTINNGLNAGQDSPRDIPESNFDPAEVNADLTRQGAILAAQLLGNPTSKTAGATIEAVTRAPNLVRATPFEWRDPKTISRREFIYGRHLIRKFVSVTVSPGGLGKTSLTITESLAMTSGKALLGVKPDVRLNVWLFNAEDPRDEMERRVMAAALHYKLRPDDFVNRLFLDIGREQDLVIAREDKRTGLKIMVPVVEAVVEQIITNEIDVMIIDPFVSTHAVSENDNGSIDAVAKLWAKIADRTNSAIEIVHHVKKVQDREITTDDARGASSLLGASRSARVLNRMSEKEAGNAGVSPEDRFSIFSVVYGKSSMSPMTGKQEWRRLHSVALGNGGGLGKPQDHVGVATEWSWPTKEDAIAATIKAAAVEYGHEAIEIVKVRVSNTVCMESVQSADWVGYVVAEALGKPIAVSRTMTPEKSEMKRLVTAWIETGVLVRYRGKNDKGREAPMVRAG